MIAFQCVKDCEVFGLSMRYVDHRFGRGHGGIVFAANELVEFR